MKNYAIAVASALLLAVAITELSARIWPESRLALLLLAFVALLINGLFNTRQAANQAQPAAAGQRAGNGAQKRRSDSAGQGGRGNQRGGKGDQSRGGAKGDRSAERKNDRNKDRGSERSERKTPAKDNPAPATPVADGPREEGTVKWFNRSKGFGFVVRPNGEEIFVHQRSIRSAAGQGRPVLKDGEQVSFVVAERERGMQAEDVVPVSAP